MATFMLKEFINRVDLRGGKSINRLSWMNLMIYFKTKKTEQAQQLATGA